MLHKPRVIIVVKDQGIINVITDIDTEIFIVDYDLELIDDTSCVCYPLVPVVSETAINQELMAAVNETEERLRGKRQPTLVPAIGEE